MTKDILTPGHTLRGFRLPGAIRIDNVEAEDEHNVSIKGLSSIEGAGSWKASSRPNVSNVIAPYAWRSYEFEVAIQAVTADQEAHGLATRDVRFNDIGAHLEARVPNTDEKWRLWLLAHPADVIEVDVSMLPSSELYAVCLVPIDACGEAGEVTYLRPADIADLPSSPVALSTLRERRFEPPSWLERIADEYDLPRAARRCSSAPFGIASACALRFDGGQYRQEHGFVDAEVTDAYLRTGRLTGTTLEKWTTFFFLQRGLGGRGLERTPPHGDYYQLFYQLFLDLYDTDIPEEYLRQPEDHDWRHDYAPHLGACVAFMRRMHSAMPYDFDAPPLM
jgi:hypothetical protein